MLQYLEWQHAENRTYPRRNPLWDMVCQVQHGRGSFGVGKRRFIWHRGTPAQKEAGQCVMCNACLEGSLGNVGGRKSFIIRAIYNVLPSPKNQWLGEDLSCLLCQTPATLHTHQVQDQPHPRTLHLDAQRSPLASGTSAERKEE